MSTANFFYKFLYPKISAYFWFKKIAYTKSLLALQTLMIAYVLTINRFNDWLGRQLSWLTTLLMLLICVDVLRRYALDATTVAILDLEWYLFSLIFLLGAGYGLCHDKHVRVDVFYHRFSETRKAWINLLGCLFFLIPFCLVCIYSTWEFTLYSYQLNEGSPEPGGLPARYLIKAAMPLGFLLLLLQAISMIFSSILIITNRPVERNKH